MRYLVAVVAALLVLSTPTFAAEESLSAFDWDSWQHLPVQAGGRRKPLDTLARETLQTLCGRSSFTDPKTDRKLHATTLYLAMLFDWQGWEQASHGQGMRMTQYFRPHKADRWDKSPLILVESRSLRKAMGLDEHEKYFSPLSLIEANVRDRKTGQQMSFGVWSQRVSRKREDLSELEEAGRELAGKLWLYQEHRMGQRLEILPQPGSELEKWSSIAALMQTKLDDQTDPGGELRSAKQQFLKVRATYLRKSPQAFDRASTEFIAAVNKLGPKLGSYPKQSIIDLELVYNTWPPYTFAWVFAVASFFCALRSMAVPGKPLYAAAIACSVACLLSILVGFGMRGVITGWIPVTNMYDSVIFMSLGTVIFGLIFELRSGKRFVLAATAVVAASSLILADYCPSVLNPSLRMPPPVLRSNFWLAIHVMSIMLSYAAFALALGIGNITLGYYLVGSKKQDLVNGLSKFIYKLLQAGVLLLAIGTILGGFWADYSWGRFWGWDPKEVWALITLLFYLAVLHARFIGWVGNLGLAAWSVTCFTVLVVMAWYGVNFVLGSDLHGYGSGADSGLYYVVAVVSVQLLYVLVAFTVAKSRDAVAQGEKLVAVSAS